MNGSGNIGWGVGRCSVLLGAGLVLFAVLAQLSVAPVFFAQRAAIRHEVKDRILAGLPQSALTVFRFSAAEYDAVDLLDGERELRSEGILFDIVRTYREAGGGYVIEAARDDQETELMADLDRMVRGRLSADTEGQEQRSRIIGAWITWFQSLDTTSFRLPDPQGIGYAQVVVAGGRCISAIDPGPPRRA